MNFYGKSGAKADKLGGRMFEKQEIKKGVYNPALHEKAADSVSFKGMLPEVVQNTAKAGMPSAVTSSFKGVVTLIAGTAAGIYATIAKSDTGKNDRTSEAATYPEKTAIPSSTGLAEIEAAEPSKSAQTKVLLGEDGTFSQTTQPAQTAETSSTVPSEVETAQSVPDVQTDIPQNADNSEVSRFNTKVIPDGNGNRTIQNDSAYSSTFSNTEPLTENKATFITPENHAKSVAHSTVVNVDSPVILKNAVPNPSSAACSESAQKTLEQVLPLQNINPEVVSKLRKSLKNIPKDKQAREKFVYDFFSTNLKTGEKTSDEEDSSLLDEYRVERIARNEDKILSSILKYALLEAMTEDKSELNSAIWRNTEFYENFENRDLFDFAEQKIISTFEPDSEFKGVKPSNILRFSTDITDSSPELYNRFNAIRKKTDIKDIPASYSFLNFLEKTESKTLQYLINHDLFNIETFKLFENYTDDIFFGYGFFFGSMQSKKLEETNFDERLKALPSRKKGYYTGDMNLLINVSSSDFEKIIALNLLDKKSSSHYYADDRYVKVKNVIKIAQLSEKDYAKVSERNLIERVGGRLESVVVLSRLDDKTFEEFCKRADLATCSVDSEKVVQHYLSLPEEICEIGKRRHFDLSSPYLLRIAREVDDNTFEIAKKRGLATGLNTPADYKILASLSDKEFQNAIEREVLTAGSFIPSKMIRIGLSEQDYKKYTERKLEYYAKSEEVRKELLHMSDKDFENVVMIDDELKRICDCNYVDPVPYETYHCLSKLPESKIRDALSYFDYNEVTGGFFDGKTLVKIVNMPKATKTRLSKVMKKTKESNLPPNSLTGNDLIALAQLSSLDLKTALAKMDDLRENFADYLHRGILLKILRTPEYKKNISKIARIREFYDKKFKNREFLTARIADRLFGVPFDVKKMPLKQKLILISEYDNLLKSSLLSEEELRAINFGEVIEKVKQSLEKIISTAPVSDANRKKMLTGFFSNTRDVVAINPATGKRTMVSSLEQTLKTKDFSQFGRDGLPLKYSRKAFLSDLTDALFELSPAEKSAIIKKLEIFPIEQNGVITGYDGILNVSALDGSDAESKIAALVKKFILENKIETGDKKLDAALNSLIAGMPEFVNVIGKQQHKTHQYSLDTHIMTVLKECLANPEYEKLSDIEKTVLKTAVILHDIAKSEFVVDTGHEELCAFYARDILNRRRENGEPARIDSALSNRIVELIKNHNWLEKYDKNLVSPSELALIFRRKGDLRIARIMAEADLKGVNKDFYEAHKKTLSPEKQTPIDEELERLNRTGHIVMTAKIVDPSKIPIQTLNGKTFKVVDFTDPRHADDFSKIGFEPGLNARNLRLFVHMCKGTDTKDFDTAYKLGDAMNQGMLCVSHISLRDNETFSQRRFGLSLEAENVNIVNASLRNQSSGRGKDFEHFRKFVETDFHRSMIPGNLKEKLSVNSDDYSHLYEQLQRYKYASGISRTPSFRKGEFVIPGKNIRTATDHAADIAKNSNNAQNEVNLYTPETNAFVAKVDKLDEIPEHLLDFAHSRNLPIYLLGSPED